MTSLFWASYALLWLFVALLVVLVLLLYRQFGLAFMRGSDRINLQGIDLGARAPELDVSALATGEAHKLSWGYGDRYAGRFLMFALPTCEICATLAPNVGELPARWPEIEFVWIDGLQPDEPTSTVRHVPSTRAGWKVSESTSAHVAMDVSAVPFAFVATQDGEVLAKQLINNEDDIETMLAQSHLVADRPRHGNGASPRTSSSQLKLARREKR